MTRNLDRTNTVAQNEVFSLANQNKTGFLEGSNGLQMRNARNLRHTRSDNNLVAIDFGSEASFDLWLDFQILSNSDADVLDRFLSGSTLTTTARQIVAP